MIILFVCLALIIALLPVVIMRKVKESNGNKKREIFLNNCKSLKIGMSKNEVISILGNDYMVNCDLDGEYYQWIKQFSAEKLTCVVMFKKERVIKIDTK